MYIRLVHHAVWLFTPALAGTKLYCLVTEAHWCEQLTQGYYTTALYCLVTEAHWCEQLTQGYYTTAQRLWLKLATTESLH